MGKLFEASVGDGKKPTIKPGQFLSYQNINNSGS